jgi:hypothetical protein
MERFESSSPRKYTLDRVQKTSEPHFHRILPGTVLPATGALRTWAGTVPRGSLNPAWERQFGEVFSLNMTTKGLYLSKIASFLRTQKEAGWLKLEPSSASSALLEDASNWFLF